LNGDGSFTIFAPTDAAFAKLPPGVLDRLMQNPAKFKALLLYHITVGNLTIKEMLSRTDKSITMMDYTKVNVSTERSMGLEIDGISPANSTLKANIHDNDLSPALMVINKSARVTIADLSASNGVIHVIDTVLAPGTHWLAAVSDVSGEVAADRISSLAAPVGESTSTSRGFFIGCPVKETRTEVTTQLPQPWWNTPQIGKLERVSVQTIGGNRTLVCEYWAYGRSVSIMRAFPEGTTDCSAAGNGFQCH
jgi:hypothetical protein